MTQDTYELPPLPEPGTNHYEWGGRPEKPERRYFFTADQMQAYARLAIQQERERCAKLCDEVERQQDNDNGLANTGGAAACAEAIRKG